MTWLTSFLRRTPIGWWDLVDILVVSILIYEVLKLIRGTRAVQMALGGSTIVALFYGSRWFHLETVNWVVRNLVGYIVFAVIVLFQSDIRRALAHLGRAPFFRYFAKAESAAALEKLGHAAPLPGASGATTAGTSEPRPAARDDEGRGQCPRLVGCQAGKRPRQAGIWDQGRGGRGRETLADGRHPGPGDGRSSAAPCQVQPGSAMGSPGGGSAAAGSHHRH
jgi:hypothetical protein